MKKSLLLLIILASCSSPKDSFRYYFDSEIENSKVALSLPKWLPMMFVPKEAKDEVRSFSKGMQKMKILVYDDSISKSTGSFDEFARENNFENYLSYKKGKDNFKILSKETEEKFKEVILEIQSEEEHIIIGLIGNMEKSQFNESLKKLREQADRQD